MPLQFDSFPIPATPFDDWFLTSLYGPDTLNVHNIVTYTSSITLVASDRGKIVEMDSVTAATVTVPPNSEVPFPLGTEIEVEQYGAGQVTFVAGSGVTIRSKDGLLALSAQYTSATIYKRAINEWVVLVGDLASSDGGFPDNDTGASEFLIIF